MDKVLARINSTINDLDNAYTIPTEKVVNIKNRMGVLKNKYIVENSLHNISMVNALCNEVKILICK